MGADTAERRAAVDRLRALGVPIAEGCGVTGISRSAYYAVPQDSTSSALKRESQTVQDARIKDRTE